MNLNYKYWYCSDLLSKCGSHHKILIDSIFSILSLAFCWSYSNHHHPFMVTHSLYYMMNWFDCFHESRHNSCYQDYSFYSISCLSILSESLLNIHNNRLYCLQSTWLNTSNLLIIGILWSWCLVWYSILVCWYLFHRLRTYSRTTLSDWIDSLIISLRSINPTSEPKWMICISNWTYWIKWFNCLDLELSIHYHCWLFE